jgi:hypothetical protein
MRPRLLIGVAAVLVAAGLVMIFWRRHRNHAHADERAHHHLELAASAFVETRRPLVVCPLPRRTTTTFLPCSSWSTRLTDSQLHGTATAQHTLPTC